MERSLRQAFVPLGAQLEDEEAEASQPMEEKVSDRLLLRCAATYLSVFRYSGGHSDQRSSALRQREEAGMSVQGVVDRRVLVTVNSVLVVLLRCES